VSAPVTSSSAGSAGAASESKASAAAAATFGGTDGASAAQRATLGAVLLELGVESGRRERAADAERWTGLARQVLGSESKSAAALDDGVRALLSRSPAPSFPVRRFASAFCCI
jgi:hypothetical protein